jgi:hypothetical protein
LLKRVEWLERENASIKRFSKIAFGSLAALLVAVAAVPKANTGGPPVLKGSEFDLIGPSGAVTAKFATYRGGPNLVLYDNNGKLVETVGVVNDQTVAQAGLNVFDGNAIVPAKGVGRFNASVRTRNTSGQGGTGEGIGTFDGSGILRATIGQSVDGSAVYATGYDANNGTNARVGWIFEPSINFSGFFTNAEDGTSRSYFGQTTQTDPSVVEAFWGLNYANGSPAVNGYTPTTASPLVGMNVWDTNGAYRSVAGLEFFGVFDGSENLIAHIP